MLTKYDVIEPIQRLMNLADVLKKYGLMDSANYIKMLDDIITIGVYCDLGFEQIVVKSENK